MRVGDQQLGRRPEVYTDDNVPGDVALVSTRLDFPILVEEILTGGLRGDLELEEQRSTPS